MEFQAKGRACWTGPLVFLPCFCSFSMTCSRFMFFTDVLTHNELQKSGHLCLWARIGAILSLRRSDFLTLLTCAMLLLHVFKFTTWSKTSHQTILPDVRFWLKILPSECTGVSLIFLDVPNSIVLVIVQFKHVVVRPCI